MVPLPAVGAGALVVVLPVDASVDKGVDPASTPRPRHLRRFWGPSAV
jgi:hypothetical protein